MRKKVTVVGGGFVGSTTAQRIVDKELADVVLTDILDGPPAGKGLDMLESGPITRTDSHATGISTASGDYSATANSDVVVITAGFDSGGYSPPRLAAERTHRRDCRAHAQRRGGNCEFAEDRFGVLRAFGGGGGNGGSHFEG